MQAFSLSVLIIFFFPFFWCCFIVLKCNSAATNKVKYLEKSLQKHFDPKQTSSSQLYYSEGQGFSC